MLAMSSATTYHIVTTAFINTFWRCRELRTVGGWLKNQRRGRLVTSSTDGTVTCWARPPPIEQTWVIKTEHTAAYDRVPKTSGDGGLSTPTIGQWVQVVDVSSSWATNNLTIARKSSTMMGGTTDLIANVSNSSFYLVYSDATNGWRIV